MILHRNSRTLKVLTFLANPTPVLPQLFPLWIEQARVGSNMTDFLRVTFKGAAR